MCPQTPRRKGAHFVHEADEPAPPHARVLATLPVVGARGRQTNPPPLVAVLAARALGTDLTVD